MTTNKPPSTTTDYANDLPLSALSPTSPMCIKNNCMHQTTKDPPSSTSKQMSDMLNTTTPIVDNIVPTSSYQACSSIAVNVNNGLAHQPQLLQSMNASEAPIIPTAYTEKCSQSPSHLTKCKNISPSTTQMNMLSQNSSFTDCSSLTQSLTLKCPDTVPTSSLPSSPVLQNGPSSNSTETPPTSPSAPPMAEEENTSKQIPRELHEGEKAFVEAQKWLP